jgi:hypothetical protein
VMKATLIDYTGKGSGDPWYAANLMIFTKNTRVKMGPDGLDDIAAWPVTKKMAELEYMANTIPSSWEFCRYTFLLEGVTRSLTHQLVRTRTAAYAQQTMQILDMTGFTYHVGPSVQDNSDALGIYEEHMRATNSVYAALIKMGVSVEDARELLPHGIHTNITMTDSLRSYINLFHTRISPRNLGMFSELCRMMRDAITDVHPWSKLFLDRTFDKAAEELDTLVRKEPGGTDPTTDKYKKLKLIDQMRRAS